MSILNLTCLINIACARGSISFDSLSPRDRREASADTDRNFDLTTICNNYTPEARQIKGKILKLRAFILSFSIEILVKPKACIYRFGQATQQTNTDFLPINEIFFYNSGIQ
jgi:hypothetical protein